MILEKLKDNDFAFGLLTRALDIIGRIAGEATADTASAAVDLIQRVYTAVTDVAEGRITPEAADEAFKKLEASLTKNDATADAALDQKFGD